MERSAEYRIEINSPLGAGPSDAYEVATAVRTSFWDSDTEVNMDQAATEEVGADGNNYRVDVNVIFTYWTTT